MGSLLGESRVEQGALNAKPQLMLAVSTGRKIQAWNSCRMNELPHAEWRPWPVNTLPTDGGFRGYLGVLFF